VVQWFALRLSAAQHLEKQLKRYKQRIKDHHKARRQPVKYEEAASYVIGASSGEGEEPTDLNPVVIAETATAFPNSRSAKPYAVER